jgi:[ribosomal protein S5]-alanine N-acetyltransferase
MQLTGPRVLLREFSKSDVAALAAIHSDPRLRYYSPEVGTLEHTQMLVELFIQWANENPRDNFQLAIVDRERDALVGSCGVRSKGCASGRAEFGIGIGSPWWGKGIAREAARIILEFGFSDLHLNEVYGVAVSANTAFSRLAQRLGFTSGITRSGDAWLKERNWSLSEWVITRETWNQQATA